MNKIQGPSPQLDQDPNLPGKKKVHVHFIEKDDFKVVTEN